MTMTSCFNVMGRMACRVLLSGKREDIITSCYELTADTTESMPTNGNDQRQVIIVARRAHRGRNLISIIALLKVRGQNGRQEYCRPSAYLLFVVAYITRQWGITYSACGTPYTKRSSSLGACLRRL